MYSCVVLKSECPALDISAAGDVPFTADVLNAAAQAEYRA
jgi:hypothetical protein